jgi:hypothetical protein
VEDRLKDAQKGLSALTQNIGALKEETENRIDDSWRLFKADE